MFFASRTTFSPLLTIGLVAAHFGASSPNQYDAVTPPSMRKATCDESAILTHERAATFPTSSGVPARPAADTSIIRR